MLHRTLSATSGVVLPNILNILNETEGVVTAPHHQQVRLPALQVVGQTFAAIPETHLQHTLDRPARTVTRRSSDLSFSAPSILCVLISLLSSYRRIFVAIDEPRSVDSASRRHRVSYTGC